MTQIYQSLILTVIANCNLFARAKTMAKKKYSNAIRIEEGDTNEIALITHAHIWYGWIRHPMIIRHNLLLVVIVCTSK